MMGMALPVGTAYWDPTGSPITTSDPIRSPYGPAIVLKPGRVLAPNVTYTVKLTASMVTDRKGNPMADQNGNVVSGTYTKTFKTENITTIVATSTGDITAAGVSITPNEVLTIGFNTGIDETSVMCTVKNGATTVPVLAFGERGADATMCSAPKMGMIGAPNDDLLLNFFPFTGADAATAMPMNWAAGMYTIDCTGKDDSYGMGSFHFTGSFEVAGMPTTAKDPAAIDNHQFPSQCTGM